MSGAQGILDAFEAMTLGPGAPGQQDPTMDPAYYPRPTGEDASTAGQPPPPFQPGNCDPRFMRLTCNAIPSQQASPFGRRQQVSLNTQCLWRLSVSRMPLEAGVVSHYTSSLKMCC